MDRIRKSKYFPHWHTYLHSTHSVLPWDITLHYFMPIIMWLQSLSLLTALLSSILVTFYSQGSGSKWDPSVILTDATSLVANTAEPSDFRTSFASSLTCLWAVVYLRPQYNFLLLLNWVVILSYLLFFSLLGFLLAYFFLYCYYHFSLTFYRF